MWRFLWFFCYLIFHTFPCHLAPQRNSPLMKWSSFTKTTLRLFSMLSMAPSLKSSRPSWIGVCKLGHIIYSHPHRPLVLEGSIGSWSIQGLPEQAGTSYYILGVGCAKWLPCVCVCVCVCVLINWYMCIVSGGRPSVKEPLLFCYVLFNNRHSKKNSGCECRW